MEMQQKAAQREGYSLTIDDKDVLQLHIIDEQMIDQSIGHHYELLAFGVFDTEKVPHLEYSELHFFPEDETSVDMIRGSVVAELPDAWNYYGADSNMVLMAFDEYLRVPNVLPTGYRAIAEHASTDIYTAKDEFLLTVDKPIIHRNGDALFVSISFTLPANMKNKETKHSDLIAATNFWAITHDFMASAGNAHGIPIRHIEEQNEYTIYVGGNSRQQVHELEQVIIEAFSNYALFDSDVKTPELSEIDYQKLDEHIHQLSDHAIVQLVQRVIMEKRRLEQTTGIRAKVYTEDILFAMYQ